MRVHKPREAWILLNAGLAAFVDFCRAAQGQGAAVDGGAAAVGAPTLEEQARARFRKLSSKLVAALKPLDAHTKKKPTAPFAFDEAAIAMSRLARLVTVQPQAAAAALKPIDGLGERLVAAVEARKEKRAPADGGLVACTTLLLQASCFDRS